MILPDEIKNIVCDGAMHLANKEFQVNEKMQSFRTMGTDKVMGLHKSKNRRRSYDKDDPKAMLHMVSAWASGQRLVLAQQTVDAKSNEIKAIPALLDVLDVRGCIVTIDAMGTQTDIAAHAWRQVVLLRCYAKYLTQIGIPFSQNYIKKDIEYPGRFAVWLPGRPGVPRLVVAASQHAGGHSHARRIAVPDRSGPMVTKNEAVTSSRRNSARMTASRYVSTARRTPTATRFSAPRWSSWSCPPTRPTPSSRCGSTT